MHNWVVIQLMFVHLFPFEIYDLMVKRMVIM